MVKSMEYKRLFKEGLRQADLYGSTAALGTDVKQQGKKSLIAQTAHEHVALHCWTKRGIEKYERARKALQKSYTRKGHGQRVPKSWLGLDKQEEIKGDYGWIPRGILVRNPEGYYSSHTA